MDDDVDQQWTFNPYIWGLAVITSHVLMFFSGFTPVLLLGFLMSPSTFETFAVGIAVGTALGFVNYFRTARHTATPIYHLFLVINRRWPW